MIRIRVPDGIRDLSERCIARTSTVGDQDLTVGKMHKLWHDARLEHMLNLPPLLDSLFRYDHPAALCCRNVLGGEVGRLNGGINGDTTTDKDLRSVVWR